MILTRWLYESLRARLSRAATPPADQSLKVSVVLESVPTWTPEHRDQLRAFLLSAAGLSLVKRLRATEADVAVAGARDKQHTAHAAGRTCGYGDCVRQILSLSSAADAQPQSTLVAGDQANDIEAGGDRQPDELRDYLARFSP